MTAETTSAPEQSHRHVVCGAGELPPGTTRAFQADGRRLVIGHVPGVGPVAVADQCPHQGAPLSSGKFEPMWVADDVGEHKADTGRWVLVCPHHNFEVDVRSGCPVAPLGRRRNATYETRIEEDEVVVYI
jgi:nitrite reductase (NADH) small subunit